MKRFNILLGWLGLLLLAIIIMPTHAAVAATVGNHQPALAFIGFGGLINIFDTRTMLQAVLQFKRPKRFLLDTFFPGTKQFDTKTVDIDTYKGKRRMAPFVSPVVEGKIMARLGYTTNSYTPPYIKPKRPTIAGDLLVRRPGQTIYGNGMSMEQRASEILAADLMDLDDTITRREEWMASQAITLGTIAVVGDGVNDSIDFGLAAAHKAALTGQALWTDTTNSNPITSLSTFCRLISQDSGVVPNVAVLGSDVAAAFLDHPVIKANGGVLSVVKLTLGQIQPQLLADGVTFLGTLTGPDFSLDLYTYSEWYVDDTDGTEKPMVPVDKIIIGSTRAQNYKLYGAIQDLQAAGNFAVSRFPKSWEEEDPSVRYLMLQSASLVALNQPDASGCFKCV